MNARPPHLTIEQRFAAIDAQLANAAARHADNEARLDRVEAILAELGACADCGHLTCDCDADMGEDPADSIAEAAAAEDEPPLCESFILLPSGKRSLKCIQYEGHDGPHSALHNTYRWTGSGPDARKDEGSRLAPVAEDKLPAPQCPAGLLRDGEDWGAACQHDAGHEPPHDGQDGEWTDDHPRHLPDLDARFPAPGEAPATLLGCGCAVPGDVAPGTAAHCVNHGDTATSGIAAGGMVVRGGVEYAAPAGGAA